MKCMICGGQTLPGAKLCLPCRAALRRARDDTISELLPLPRRREAFAFSHSPDIGRAAPLAPAARPVTERAVAGSRSRRRLSSAQLHAAAVVAFVTAAGVLTFIMARELQRERTPAGVADSVVQMAEPKSVTPRVSPSTMLGNARDEMRSASAPVDFAEPDLPIAPSPVERKSARPFKARGIAAKAPVVLDPLPAPAPVDPPLIITAAPPAPAPIVRVAPPDRVQLLAGALAKCTGDFLARFGCEHRTRAQHCEGQWGQNPQCPAGISNDHGQ
jgi:hypothetical protein